MTIPQVIQGKEGAGYFVRSATTPGAFYLVHNNEEGDLDCTCPATVTCRHMRLAAEFWKAQDAALNARRPKMAPAPAGCFVD